MRLAVLTDVHGDRAGLSAALGRAGELGVEAVVCMGDVLECRVSKREFSRFRFRSPADVFDQDPALAESLSDAVVLRGNQEERIRALVPEREIPHWARPLLDAPLEHRTAFAVYCHGHPGPWREVEPGRWCLLEARFETRALFHGHHHRSAVYRLPEHGRDWAHTEVVDFRYGEPVTLAPDRRYLVNVGQTRGPAPTWALVDEEASTVTFHRITMREAG